MPIKIWTEVTIKKSFNSVLSFIDDIRILVNYILWSWLNYVYNKIVLFNNFKTLTNNIVLYRTILNNTIICTDIS